MKFWTVSGLCVLAALSQGCNAKGGGEGEPGTDPLYAMMVQVYSPTDRTVYLSLSGTVDITSTNLESSREFPGVANFAAIDGKILVSSGTEPVISEFEITDDFKWLDRRKVSFADYPLQDNANFYAQFVVDEGNALLPYDSTKRIHWDPSAMAIKGKLEDTTLVGSEAGLTLDAGGNRNSVHYDGSVMQAFFYHDQDWFDYGTKSHLVVYDAETFRESKVLDIACPGLTLATRDESGNTYFATWDLPQSSVKGDRPAPCVAKVTPDHTITTVDPRTWTSGRFVNNFRYIGNGKAVGNVLHHEELGVAQTSDLTAEQLGSLWQSGPHWKLWLFDVDAGSGAPVAGIDVDLGSGAQFAVLDGRTFVFLPYEDWGRTKIYELDATGQATMRVDTVGDVFKWVRVR